MILLRVTFPSSPEIVQRLSGGFDLARARACIDDAIVGGGRLTVLTDDGITLLDIDTKTCLTIAIVDETVMPQTAESFA